VCNEFKGNIIYIGDSNISNVNWNNYTSTSSSNSSLILLKAIRDNFLTQHTVSPTRARGADTPHILDLVISNNPIINEINQHASLGHSMSGNLMQL
jgi:Endonuclease-reverse transcriptase